MENEVEKVFSNIIVHHVVPRLHCSKMRGKGWTAKRSDLDAIVEPTYGPIIHHSYVHNLITILDLINVKKRVRDLITPYPRYRRLNTVLNLSIAIARRLASFVSR